jgi:hypothetical protein
MIVPVSKCRVNNKAKIIKRRKTMATKKALCVGINDYPGGGDLRGCVNDANAWANLLQDKFGFTEVKTLFDAQATKQNILDELTLPTTMETKLMTKPFARLISIFWTTNSAKFSTRFPTAFD